MKKTTGRRSVNKRRAKTTNRHLETLSATTSHWIRRRATVGLNIERTALELFLKRGTDEVTVEEIARAAKISRRTFFRYFQSRDDILAAMPARALIRTSQAVGKRPAGESIIDALIATARDRHFSAEEEEIMRLSSEVMARLPEAWARALGRLRRATDEVFTEMVITWLRRAGRSELGADVIGAALAAVVVHLYRQWVSERCVGEFADRVQQGLYFLTELTLPARRKRR